MPDKSFPFSINGVVQKISRTSAFYPILMFLALLTILVCASIWFQNILAIIITSVIFGFASWKLLGFFEYAMKHNPDLLRTEEHVIQSRALELLGDNLSGAEIVPADVLAIVNPTTRSIAGPDDSDRPTV